MVILQMSTGQRESCTAMGVVTANFNRGQSKWLLLFPLNAARKIVHSSLDLVDRKGWEPIVTCDKQPVLARNSSSWFHVAVYLWAASLGSYLLVFPSGCVESFYICRKHLFVRTPQVVLSRGRRQLRERRGSRRHARRLPARWRHLRGQGQPLQTNHSARAHGGKPNGNTSHVFMVS